MFILYNIFNLRTPFHVDVFTSFSWSTNICGQKKWIFVPPDQVDFLRDSLRNLPYDVAECKDNDKYIEVIQNSGDAIFVPSGWYHQVWNLENTISINHNWVNGCNIKNMWVSIVENLNAVKKEIEDCKDMDDWICHCQIVLKASHGIDFYTFYDFLHCIAIKRLDVLILKKDEKQFSGFKIGKNHAKFDLIKIYEVLELFINHEDFEFFEFVKDNVKCKPQELLSRIKNYLFK